MCTIDIIILICFIPAIVTGIMKGFISQVISLVSVLLGAWLAFHFSELVCNWLAQYLVGVSDTLLHVIGFVVVLLVVVLLLGIAGRLVKKIIKLASLGWLDWALGIIFAVAKAALIVSLVLVLFDNINAKFTILTDEKIAESYLYSYLRDLGNTIFPYLRALTFKQ